jgi:hypothetical protein
MWEKHGNNKPCEDYIPDTTPWSPTPLPHTSSSVKSGFHVRYQIKPAEFGKGLYAVDDIPSGTLMWKYSPGKRDEPNVNVIVYTNEAEVRARLQEIATADERRFWIDHVYMFAGKLNEILDDGMIFNHSETPCTGVPPAGDAYCFESTYSLRDIKAGEQFLDDYGLYEYPAWYTALTQEFNCERDGWVNVKPAPTRQT